MNKLEKESDFENSFVTKTSKTIINDEFRTNDRYESLEFNKLNEDNLNESKIPLSIKTDKSKGMLISNGRKTNASSNYNFEIVKEKPFGKGGFCLRDKSIKIENKKTEDLPFEKNNNDVLIKENKLVENVRIMTKDDDIANYSF